MMVVSIDEEVDELFPEETTVEMDEPLETEAPAVVNLTARSVPKCMPKPGSKSTIWEYFGYKQDGDGKLIEDDGIFCNICHRSVSAKSGNTSNLMSHLKNNHKSVHAQLKTAKTSSSTAAKQPSSKQHSIETSFGLVQPYQCQSKKWKELTDAITHFIVKDGLPVYTVQKDGFRSMIKRFDGRYELPNQSYFSRTATPALYTVTKERVVQQLSSVSYFASTTDMWSSIGTKPYMSFTVHFIDEDWKMQSLLLSTHFLPEDHTAPVIAEALQASLVEWNLMENNLVCLTTDSGANINPLIAVLFEQNLSNKKKKKKKKMNIVGFEPETPDCKLSALPA